ncbi:MAG: SpoIID/LytB domain-containing protein [Sedimentibacter sp.]
MRKLIQKITLITALAFLFSISTSYASEEEYVRVRIRSPRLFNEQAVLEGYENITVYELNDNANDLFKLEESKVTVLLDSYFDDSFNFKENKDEAVFGPNHVGLDEIYSSYEEALEKSAALEENYNFDFYPQLSSEGFKIYGGYFTSDNEAEDLLDKLINEGYDGEIISTDMENVIVYNEDNNVVFMYDNSLDIFFSTYNEDESSDMIKIDNRPFRGLIGFKIIENAKLISINYVDLESYLYGVVPNEISASWGIESLKAQAVAARTYAVSSINPNASYGYDLEDNQNSQVYRGFISEKESTSDAVDDTRGEMIYYDDNLIQAFYHSTSGGSTENSENVWYDKLPYLVGVEDEFSNRSGSPYNEWQKSYQKNEIIKKLKDDGNDVTKLYGIEITKVTDNNRVLECIFLTDNGEIVYKKENARLLLGLMSSWFTVENGSIFYFTNEFTYDNKADSDEKNESSDMDEIPSRGGIIDSIIEEDEAKDEESKTESILSSGSVLGKYIMTNSGTKKLNLEKVAVISAKGVSILETNSSDYNFQGRGWGHGIGMSQYGAKQMAAEGFTYDEILEHYYTGVIIK